MTNNYFIITKFQVDITKMKLGKSMDARGATTVHLFFLKKGQVKLH